MHLLFVAIVLGMVSAAFWQLGRYHEKRDRNRLLDERAAEALIDVPGQLDPGANGVEVRDLEWRLAQATGTYLPEEEVLVRSRSRDGAPGAWVLTPLRTTAGVALVVNRGWIPASGPPTLPPGAEAPEGPVTVQGLLVAGQSRGRFGPKDPPEGQLATLARADLDRLQQQVDEDLYPLYLQLQQQVPAPGELPVPLADPERDEGPHLSYAGQWFLFTAIALIGYPLLIRRSKRAREAASRRAARLATVAVDVGHSAAGPGHEPAPPR